MHLLSPELGLILWTVLIFSFLLLHVIALIHLATFNAPNKVLWAIIIIFTPAAGALIYLFIGKKYIPQSSVERQNLS